MSVQSQSQFTSVENLGDWWNIRGKRIHQTPMLGTFPFKCSRFAKWNGCSSLSFQLALCSEGGHWEV